MFRFMDTPAGLLSALLVDRAGAPSRRRAFPIYGLAARARLSFRSPFTCRRQATDLVWAIERSLLEESRLDGNPT